MTHANYFHINSPSTLRRLYTITCVLSPYAMSPPRLYPEIVGNRCARLESPSLSSHFPLIYLNNNIKIIHQRIQTTCEHAPRRLYCHYYNVDFVLFHNVTCLTNSLLSCIHVNTAHLLDITCTLVTTCMILGRLECTCCNIIDCAFISDMYCWWGPNLKEARVGNNPNFSGQYIRFLVLVQKNPIFANQTMVSFQHSTLGNRHHH